jgi:ankyrin repeat protein
MSTINIRNLPVDLVLQHLASLPFKDLTRMCSTDKAIKNICTQHQDWLYTQLLQREFGLTDMRPKRIFELLTFIKLNKSTDILDKSKHYDLITDLVKKNKTSNITFLVKHGVDINAKNSIGWTPLMYALKHSTPEIISHILDTTNPDINAKSVKGWTPLMAAILHSTPEIIYRILDTNPDINAKDKNGWTSLMSALRYSTPEIINRILDTTNPDINTTNSDGWTPLMFALRHSTPKIINRILDMNPDISNINAKNKNGWTPLMIALRYSTPEIINRILDMNPDINTKDEDGKTPLMLALKYSTPEIINRILNMNPKMSKKDIRELKHFAVQNTSGNITPEIIQRIHSLVHE